MFCMTAAIASVEEDMLRCVWNELHYRIAICRVTKGSHTHTQSNRNVVIQS
jgi:hypothetical protein